MSPKSTIEMPAEFTSAMQQLVAEAAKDAASVSSPSESEETEFGSAEVHDAVAAMDQRLERIEAAVAAGFARLSAPAQAAPESGEVAAQLRKIDEHLTALRNTESVNHRLFNTLHQELKTYRDNFLRESLQKPFIRDLVVLFDDLSSLSSQMQNAAGAMVEGSAAKLGQWRANLENNLHALLEVLHRLEVKEIEPSDTVDLTRHRVVSYEPADFPEEDGRIMLRLRRGFIWRDQVLRPEEVVAKRFG